MNRHASRAGLGAATALGASAATLVLAFVLTACTGGANPIVTETPSPAASASPSASPSPSLTPLTDEELLDLLPEDAAYPDIRGAIATAKFFLEEYNAIYLTGDFRVWDALSGLDCAFCDSSRAGASELQSQGGYRDGGTLSFDEGATQANFYDKTGYWYVIVSVSWTPTNDHFPDGSTVPDGDGGAANISFEMEPVDGIWRVRDVGVEETG